MKYPQLNTNYSGEIKLSEYSEIKRVMDKI